MVGGREGEWEGGRAGEGRAGRREGGREGEMERGRKRGREGLKKVNEGIILVDCKLSIMWLDKF